ncbi:MAG: glycosyltransferase family 2 protein [Selenomonadaceae bacterium]|nr:glycosyltransferase family 2 protein [Selenomonadaceae bacterium]
MNCGLVIPTLNAGSNFEKLLQQINSQTLPTKKLIVDSESTDGTPELAQKFGFEVLKVQRKNFNHGATRQSALEKILPLDVIIFLTQDIFLKNETTLENLVKIFETDSEVGLSYGRQLPHSNATLEAKILREFNYPAKNQLRTFDSRKSIGMRAAMASNSFAAYKVEILQKVGGFPNVILCEDMYIAAKMLMGGYKTFYNAFAQVYHSHNYTAAQEFRRYFDIGVFHNRESWIRENFGGAGRVGKKFVYEKYSALWQDNPRECCAAFFRDVMKFLGYSLGRLEKILPRFIIKNCTMHKNFWREEV